MRFFTLLKANMKRQRRSLFSLFILIFIITVSLCTVLTIWKNSNTYEMNEMQRLGFGDISIWMPDISEKDHLIKEIEDVKETQKVEVQEIIFTDYLADGEESQNTGQLTVFDPSKYDYHICNDSLIGMNSNPEPLKRGEIYVSPSFASIYHTELEDLVTIKMTETEVKDFKIKGYFEDPFMGSSMLGVKTMLISDEDREEILDDLEKAGQDARARAGLVLHVYKSNDNSMSVSDYLGYINQNTEVKTYATNIFQQKTYAGFMLILQNVFSGFLLIFVTILLIVAIIVMSHSINSNIEQNYVNLGIMKATGFSLWKLKILMLEQYLISILLGIVCGIAVSDPVVGFVNSFTVTSTGLMIPSKLPITLCLVSLLMITLLLVGIIIFKTAKIGKITPIRAIRGGAEDFSFRSRFTFPIYKKGTEFWLALRQLASGKKQYIGVIIISLLLVFFMSVVGRGSAWIGSDGQGLMNSFGATSYDIQVLCNNIDQKKEVDQFVRNHSSVVDSYKFKVEYAMIRNISYMVNITDKPEEYHILSGRTCKYDNEMLVTESVAKELNIHEGDTVEVSFYDKTAEFVVTGINQCANDMGANFSINLDGYKRLGEVDDDEFFTYYTLEDYSQRQPLMDLLTQTYGDDIQMEENTWTGLDAILNTMSAITFLMYLISVIFVLVVTEMTGSKILYKEQHDLGIYKSLGFSAEKLRKAFALRFGIAAVIGSALGALAGAFLTNPIVTLGLKVCGISIFNSQFVLSQTLIPAVVIILIFIIFAYLAAGKIKRIESTILIAD